MPTTRRNVLGAFATLAAVGAGATQVFGKEGESELPIKVSQVAPKEEFVVFENTSIHDVDVSGYIVAFEYGNSDTDQRKPLPENTTIGNGQSLIVATGAKEVPEASVNLGYDGDVINNDGNDVIALLTPDGSSVVAKSDSSSSNDTTTTTTTEDDGGSGDNGGSGTTTTTTDNSDSDNGDSSNDTTTTTTTTTDNSDSDNESGQRC